MRKSNTEIIAEALEVSMPPKSEHAQDFLGENQALRSVEGDLIPVDQDMKHHAIILMGLTGTGKSSFISLLKGKDIGIGHDLESYTSRSRDYAIQLDPHRIVHLIDTPGFNDTNAKDSDILREIAFFLNKMYEERVELNGVIFLHRITDPRVSGASLRNLHILQKLCGESASSHVALTSTMWGNLGNVALGAEREKELLQNGNFWAPLAANGAVISRHDGSIESAKTIIETLIQRGTTVLNIQRQMVDQNLSLDETTAGQYLQGEMIRAKEKQEKELAELEEALKEAVEDKDQSLIELLTKQRLNQVELLSQGEAEQRELRVSSNSLDIEKGKVLNHLKAQRAQEEMQREEEIHALRAQIESLQDNLVDTQMGRSRDVSRVLKDRETLIMHNKRLEHTAMMQEQNSEHQRRALRAQLAAKERELHTQGRKNRSSGIGVFFRDLFAYDDISYDEDRAYGYRRAHSSSGREHSQKLQKRSTQPAPPYQALGQRTFRSNDPGHERQYH